MQHIKNKKVLVSTDEEALISINICCLLMPSMSHSDISCQAQPNINQQANTFLDIFAYTTIKCRKCFKDKT